MHDLAKKVGSLLLGVGALGLLLVNAALAHGCGGTRANAPTAQAPNAAMAPAAETTARDECAPDPYMYATKAPIFVPPQCRGGEAPAQQAAEPQLNNAQAR